MASEPVEFDSPSGLTLTANLFPISAPDTAASGSPFTCTERTNNKGSYTLTAVGLTGVHKVQVLSGTSTVAKTAVLLTNDTATKFAADLSDANLIQWLGTAPLALSSQQVQAIVPDTQKVDLNTVKTNPVVNGGTVTFPTNSTLASTTNISAGTIANLTNAPTSGDFTATMKTSLNAATPAVTVSDKTGFALTAAYDAAKTAASQSSVDDLPTNAELAIALAAADDAVLAAIAALNNLSASGLFDAQMTESYAADGTAPTLAQSLFLIQQVLTEFAITGTTNRINKLDGSTQAATLTYDSATAPTSATRSA